MSVTIRYRVGRDIPRTIYRHYDGDEAGKLIGMMDTREDAARVVEALNDPGAHIAGLLQAALGKLGAAQNALTYLLLAVDRLQAQPGDVARMAALFARAADVRDVTGTTQGSRGGTR